MKTNRRLCGNLRRLDPQTAAATTTTTTSAMPSAIEAARQQKSESSSRKQLNAILGLREWPLCGSAHHALS
jgi:hypothetical protein